MTARHFNWMPHSWRAHSLLRFALRGCPRQMSYLCPSEQTPWLFGPASLAKLIGKEKHGRGVLLADTAQPSASPCSASRRAPRKPAPPGGDETANSTNVSFTKARMTG